MYNVEKYIGRCLLSVQNQTFSDFEVLVIDDESADSSAEIVGEFQKKDERITLYIKKNGGPGKARNYGIERAKGEYIVFIDSDDTIADNYLEVLYHECVNNKAEIACCRFYDSYCHSKLKIPMPFAPRKGVMPKEKALDKIIRDTFMRNYVWNKMYRRSLFIDNDILYPDMTFFEDMATNSRLIFHCQKVAVSAKYLYYYKKRGGSIMTKLNAEKLNDYVLALLITRNYLQYRGAYEHYRRAIHSFARKIFLSNLFSIINMHLPVKDFNGMKRNFRINRELYRYLISDSYEACEAVMPELPVRLLPPVKK